MIATLHLYSLTLAAGDVTQNSNPSLRYVDWKRQIQGLPVENPQTDAFSLAPGAEKTIFDGSRVLLADVTTSYSLQLGALGPDRYRLVHTGGTAPAFRTARTVPVATVALALTALANGTLTVSAASGTPFATVQVGDEVFVPGVTTGDPATVFSVLNEGTWFVAGSTPTLLTLARQGDFQGVTETRTPASNTQFQIFSSSGVQVGDKVELASGFFPANLKTLTVVGVTPTMLDVTSTSPLVAQGSVTPGVTGVQVFGNAKRFVRVEADQEVVLRANGDLGSSQRISPWAAGDPALVGEYTRTGPTWSLKILNKASVPVHVTVISAE